MQINGNLASGNRPPGLLVQSLGQQRGKGDQATSGALAKGHWSKGASNGHNHHGWSSWLSASPVDGTIDGKGKDRLRDILWKAKGSSFDEPEEASMPFDFCELDTENGVGIHSVDEASQRKTSSSNKIWGNHTQALASGYQHPQMGFSAPWLPPENSYPSAQAGGKGQSASFFDGSMPMRVTQSAWSQDRNLPIKIPVAGFRNDTFMGDSNTQGAQAMPLARQADRTWGGHGSNGSQNSAARDSGPPVHDPGPPPGSQQQRPSPSVTQMQAMPPMPAHWEDGQCRWHKSAETVGVISEDGHVFTKMAGPRRSRVSNRGATVELASICMVFDASLRSGGVHRYCYEIMDGELGAADGAGFVFDSKVRRNNIQRMRSVFLNQRGRICLRNNQHVTKLEVQLPPLTVGVCLDLLIDLDSLIARFNVSNAQGVIGGSADVSLEGLFDVGMGMGTGQLRSGFFCAVVTGSITIGLR